MSEHPEHQSKQERGHHASCEPYDRDLVWHCFQCGLDESAEGYVERMREALISAADTIHLLGGRLYSRGQVGRTLAQIDAALSDVTEQKDLGDCPEPLGQTREETDGPTFLDLHDDLGLIGGRLMIWVEKNKGYESAAEINAVIDDATRLVTECEGDHSPSLGTVARLRKALDVLRCVPSPEPVASTQPQDGRIQKTREWLGEDKKE